MAAAQHSPPRAPLPAAPATRRDVLAAALAVPLALPCHPELVSGSSPDAAVRATSWTLNQVQGDGREETFVVTKWDRALTLYRAAESALAAVAGTEDRAYPERLPPGSRRDLYDRHLLR